MRIAITGATGLLGSHFLDAVVAQGHDVVVLLRPTSDTWRIKHIVDGIDCVRVDYNDARETVRALSGRRCEVFAHFAWSGVPGAARDEIQQYEINLPATTVALGCARHMKARTYLSIGSQAEYGKIEGLINEDYDVAPETHYARAKQIAYQTTRAYCRAANMRSVWFRLFPVYGPRETEPWLIPSLVRHLAKRQPYPMTTCEQIRDYLYIQDAVDAICSVLFHDEVEGVFNLSSGQGIKLRELIEHVRDLVAPDATLQFGLISFRDDQSPCIIGDNARLRHATGWAPRVDLSLGLKRTVEWILHEYR